MDRHVKESILHQTVCTVVFYYPKNGLIVVRKVTLHFVDPIVGKTSTVEVEEGTTVMRAAKDNNLRMEGACGGALSCGTCHVYVDKEYADVIPEIEDEEKDMLLLALETNKTSRLGCQILVRKDMDGCTFTLPKSTKNLQNN